METLRLLLPDYVKDTGDVYVKDTGDAVLRGNSAEENPPAADLEQFIAHGDNEEGEITCESATYEEKMDQGPSRKRGRRKKTPKAMEHSGLAENIPTARTMNDSDEPALCLPLKRVLNERSSHEKVAMELARCLQERKHFLLLDVVRVIGVKMALNYFHKTAEIQLSGGETTADGMRKKTPGGVFFSLVRKGTSAEECRKIFHEEKKMQVRKKKEKQLQRIMEREARIQQQEAQEAKRKWLEQVRQEKNTEKRFPILDPLSNDDDDGTDQPAGPDTTKDDLMLKCWKKSITTFPKSPVQDVGEVCPHQDTLRNGQGGAYRWASTSSASHVGDCVHRADCGPVRHSKHYDKNHFAPVSRHSSMCSMASNIALSSCFVETSTGTRKAKTRKNGCERTNSAEHVRATNSCDETMEVCIEENKNRDQLMHEESLARQFDLTDEADLDFGIHFD